MPPAHRIRSRWIKFDGGVPLFNELDRAFCGQIGRGPEAVNIVIFQRIEITIGPNAVVHQTTQQRPYRTIAVFAQNVPAGNFKSGKRAHDGQIWALRKARGICAPKQPFNIFRMFSQEIPFKHILDYMFHRLWPNRRGITFPPADNSGIGGQFDQNPIASPPSRGWRRCDNYIEI